MTINTRQESLEAAAEAYEASPMFVGDALDWVADHGHLHTAICEIACDYYRDSSRYDTTVEDVADGVVEL